MKGRTHKRKKQKVVFQMTKASIKRERQTDSGKHTWMKNSQHIVSRSGFSFVK